MTTLGLKNVNMLTKEQYDGVDVPATDELWAVEVETYSDDDGNWYRIYPDGWCEQGGNISTSFTDTDYTITFLKPFTDNKYNFQSTGSVTSGQNYNATLIPREKYSTNVVVRYRGQTTSGTGVCGVDWTAKGYIA